MKSHVAKLKTHTYFTYLYSALPVMFISLLALAAYIVDYIVDSQAEVLAYYPQNVAEGQIWRLLSAHFLHTNLTHLAMNLCALWLAFLLHKPHYKPCEYLTVFSLICIGCLSLLYLFSPGIPHYVGLSGVLHGLLLYYGAKEVLQRLLLGWLIVFGVAVKVTYEQLSEPNTELAAAIQANVIVDGHLFGAISGAIVFVMLYLKTIFK